MRALDRGRVRRQVAGENGLGDELRREERLVHAVAGERVDEAGRVADHGGVPTHEQAAAPHRQPVAARFGRALGIDPVRLAHTQQVGAQPRAFARPPAHADVDVVALGEDPAVAAGNGRDLERHRARVPLVAGEVRLEGDPVHDVAGESELLRARAVAAVGADDELGVELARVDGDALAHFRARLGGALEQEVVEPFALRHVRERRLRATGEVRAEVEPALDAVDHLLDDGLDRERQEARSAQRDAAAARLVAREARLVEQKHARARAREAVGGGRSGGAGADDGDIVGGHGRRLQSAPRGCARAAKGNGL